MEIRIRRKNGNLKIFFLLVENIFVDRIDDLSVLCFVSNERQKKKNNLNSLRRSIRFSTANLINHSTIIIYNSRVVLTSKLSAFTIIN